MLVLSRKPNEEIVVPELGITIKVVKCGRGHVRLGVSAPNSVRVWRGELAFDHELEEASEVELTGSGQDAEVDRTKAAERSAQRPLFWERPQNLMGFVAVEV